MKMKAGTRIIFSLVMLIVAAMCAAVILTFFGVFSRENVDMLYEGFFSGYGYIWAIAAGVLGVICVCLLFFGIGKKKADTIVMSLGDDGSVEITIDAFKELITRYLESRTDIVIQRIIVKPTAQNCAKITLKLSAKPEVSIPDAAGEIKTGLKDYLDTYSGINAENISMTIEPFRQPQAR